MYLYLYLDFYSRKGQQQHRCHDRTRRVKASFLYMDRASSSIAAMIEQQQSRTQVPVRQEGMSGEHAAEERGRARQSDFALFNVPEYMASRPPYLVKHTIFFHANGSGPHCSGLCFVLGPPSRASLKRKSETAVHGQVIQAHCYQGSP